MFDIECDTAEDGEDEVAMFKANREKTCCNLRYKLVLTDLNMPRMDGFEAANQINTYQKLKKISKPARICAITAYESTSVVDRCTKFGIAKVLSKPFSVDALKSVLSAYHDKQ